MTQSPGGVPEGCKLVDLDEVDGTNAEAMRRVLDGERGPMWIIAQRQSAGRGRSGRAWSSQPGNLFASFITALDCQPAMTGQLSLVAGIAVIDAIRRAGEVPGLRLKWPNDILVGTAKTGGILVESTSRLPQPGPIAVIGVGLNLVSAPDDLGRAATFLAGHALELSPREALCFLAQTMSDWIGIWNNGEGFAPVREAWLARAGSRGEALTVNTVGGPVTGSFAGIDDSGALLIDDADGRQLSFTFGDVSLAAKDTGA
jgi:BirA family transcriptional regulator, biotin operon repressor / biotin---[acetyl-CoA-carboxylase] ligase